MSGREPGRRRRVRRAGVAALLAVLATELVLGWSSLASALAQLRAPHPAWLGAAVAAAVAAMGAYALMQHRLLASAGVRVRFRRLLAVVYAAHSLSVTLPGGPAFSTRFNYLQMRRFGATAAVTSWCIALSGILSAGALAAVAAAGVFTVHGTLEWGSLAGLVATALLVVLGARHLARHPETLLPAARAVLTRVNRIRKRPADHGLDHVLRFTRQLGAAHLSPTHAAAAATHATLNWLLDALCLWLCFLAVGGGAGAISVSHLLLAYCAGMAAATITIVPGGFGIIDTALILGLVTGGGVGTATAIATVVLYRVITFGLIVGAGWVIWLAIRRRGRRVLPLPTGAPGSLVGRKDPRPRPEK